MEAVLAGQVRAPERQVVRQAQRRLDTGEADQLRQAYQAGAGVVELAGMFDISRQTVSDHLDRAGVERRPQGLAKADITEAAELYAAGWSLKRLERRFGVSAETVRQALLAADTTLRARPGWKGEKP